MKIDLRIAAGPCIHGGLIIESDAQAAIEIDASGLDILPGIIDVHGDAFERALMPRPGVMIPLAIAMAELEAQLLSNGITTAYLAVTLSWEAGLRSRTTYEMLRDYLAARPASSVPDLKLHVRFEIHNLSCIELAEADIAAGHVAMLSFNDHTTEMVGTLSDPAKAAKFANRAQQSQKMFAKDARAAFAATPDELELGRQRLARAGREAKIAMASHDDETSEKRQYFAALGVDICEFPKTQAVAGAAAAQNNTLVMGAPNILRGGSHLGWHGAETMVKAGLCNVLCSDYHYPSMLHAPYKLARNGSVCFNEAINLVTRNPAQAGLLFDRGTLATGMRGDVILVDPGNAVKIPRIMIAISNGKVAYTAPDALARVKMNIVTQPTVNVPLI